MVFINHNTIALLYAWLDILFIHNFFIIYKPFHVGNRIKRTVEYVYQLTLELDLHLDIFGLYFYFQIIHRIKIQMNDVLELINEF